MVLALRFLFCFFPHEKTGFLVLIQQIILIFFPLLCAIIKYTPRSWAPARKKNACRLELVSPRKTIFPQKQTKKHIRPGVTKQALTPPPFLATVLALEDIVIARRLQPFLPSSSRIELKRAYPRYALSATLLQWVKNRESRWHSYGTAPWFAAHGKSQLVARSLRLHHISQLQKYRNSIPVIHELCTSSINSALFLGISFGHNLRSYSIYRALVC